MKLTIDYAAVESFLETLDPTANARVIPRRRTSGSPDIVAFSKERHVGCHQVCQEWLMAEMDAAVPGRPIT